MDAENEQGETKEAQEAHLLDLYNSALQVFPNCGISSIRSLLSRFVNRLQFQLGSGIPVDSVNILHSFSTFQAVVKGNTKKATEQLCEITQSPLFRFVFACYPNIL